MACLNVGKRRNSRGRRALRGSCAVGCAMARRVQVTLVSDTGHTADAVWDVAVAADGVATLTASPTITCAGFRQWLQGGGVVLVLGSPYCKSPPGGF